MSYSDADEQEDDAEQPNTPIGRRTCLRGIAGLASAAGAAGFASEGAAAATTRHGIEFDRVVNVVDDLGLDPNGNEPVQRKLNRAEQEGTLFYFPEGEYLVTDQVYLLYNDVTGMVGEDDARLTVPERFNDTALFIDRGEYGLFENLDLDLRADGATPGLKFGAHQEMRVHDVEYIGQGIYPGSRNGNPDVNSALQLVARNPSATILAENVIARNKGLMGAYNRGSGRTGVWVGGNNVGTVTLRNCHISGFPNNGLYTSRTPGVVQVEGGTFRNNDISQIRLGSEGSYVKDAVIEVDSEKSGSPNPEDALNQRGVRIESGSIDTAGVTVENCQIHIANAPSSEGGVVGAGPAGHFEVIDTRIRIDTSWSPGVRASEPATGAYAPPRPHNVLLSGVSITGDATSGQAVSLDSRADSTVRDCCIEQEADDRVGIKLVNSDGTVVRGSTIDVGAERFEFDRTNANTWGNSSNGSCPLPAMSGGSVSPAGVGHSGGDDGDEDGVEEESGGSSSAERRRITITNKGHSLRYVLEVDGELSGFNDTIGSHEIKSDTRAEGGVWKTYHDTYEFTGEITKLVVKGGRGSMSYNGDRLKFYGNGTGDVLGYTATAPEFQATSSSYVRGTETENDRMQIDGAIADWHDTYVTDGSLYGVSLEDDFDVEIV